MTDGEHLVSTGTATRDRCPFADASSHYSGMSWLKEQSATMEVSRKYDASTMRRAGPEQIQWVVIMARVHVEDEVDGIGGGEHTGEVLIDVFPCLITRGKLFLHLERADLQSGVQMRQIVWPGEGVRNRREQIRTDVKAEHNKLIFNSSFLSIFEKDYV